MGSTAGSGGLLTGLAAPSGALLMGSAAGSGALLMGLATAAETNTVKKSDGKVREVVVKSIVTAMGG